MVLEFFQNNIAFFTFIVALSVFLYVKRHKLEVQGSFPFFYILMFKTKLGLERMDKWSQKHPRAFLYLAYLSFGIGVFGAVAVFIFMFWQLGFIVDKELTTGGGLVLPLKTDAGLESPVPVFYVPFLYWIIALFILAIVHEFAHGVISERFKIRVKSSGFAFLGILLPLVPAAFVEPDEKQLKQKPRWQQIAVFGAGSTSNFLFGALFLLVWLFIAGPLIDNTMTVEKITFSNVMNESSLSEYGVQSGEIIEVNGERDKAVFLDIFQNLTVNESLVLSIQEDSVIKDYEIKTFANPTNEERGMIGISGLDIQLGNKEGFGWLGDFPLGFERALFWIWFLNIAIGFFNLLPIWITDGGQVMRTMLDKFFKQERANQLNNLISIISLVLIIFTIWPSLLFKFLGLF